MVIQGLVVLAVAGALSLIGLVFALMSSPTGGVIEASPTGAELSRPQRGRGERRGRRLEKRGRHSRRPTAAAGAFAPASAK